MEFFFSFFFFLLELMEDLKISMFFNFFTSFLFFINLCSFLMEFVSDLFIFDITMVSKDLALVLPLLCEFFFLLAPFSPEIFLFFFVSVLRGFELSSSVNYSGTSVLFIERMVWNVRFLRVNGVTSDSISTFVQMVRQVFPVVFATFKMALPSDVVFFGSVFGKLEFFESFVGFELVN